MPIKYIPYIPDPIKGQAFLDNFVRTNRILRYADNNQVFEKIKRGLPLYEVKNVENINIKENEPNQNKENLIIRGECLSACAYLKEQGIKVDLVYIDPPFASGADYAKKIFLRKNPKQKKHKETSLEKQDFFEEKMYGDIWNKENYLNWMYENLTAIKSIMSDTASIYLHLDWHIGHYVKILMDEIFGEDNFENEIIWNYRRWTAPSNNFQQMHDLIFCYKINNEKIFNPIYVKPANEEKGVKENYKLDENGKMFRWQSLKGERYKIYRDERGVLSGDVWDIPFVHPSGSERVDYSTQKPEALLERIIKASSNQAMVVADFFGGSGVTAKVANDLGRKFIHVDIGINSIQTVRDRLIESINSKENKSSFQILEIQDGINLFRNPQQTMDKLKNLINGLQNTKNFEGISDFWFGVLSNPKLGIIPVYVPDLINSNEKVLDIPKINQIINKEIFELPDNIEKIIVYYVDIEEETEIKKFIKNQKNTLIEIELRDLKNLLSEIIFEDEIQFELKENQLEITHFKSDRLDKRINEFNEKALLQANKNGKEFNPIEISQNGLELIELIALDCDNEQGIWTSSHEIKIHKTNFISKNGIKTKEFWNGIIEFNKKPKRLKIRNITCDETIVILNK